MTVFSIGGLTDKIMLFNFENTFLQIPQTLDLSVIAIIVSSVTATILAVMVVITWKNRI